MSTKSTPFRSVLYMPGSNSRALEKAKTLPVDAVILDLEDAVAMPEKAKARDLVREAVSAGGFGHRKVIIRINALDTEWGADDLAMADEAAPHAILLPKINAASDIQDVETRVTGQARLWAMMETPLAMLNALTISAASPRLEAFVLGTNDLLKDINGEALPDRAPLATGLGLCLLAAKASGLICIDGVYNAFRDDDGLQRECEQGRAMGFDGKTLIHPAQIAITNAAFSPDADAIALAKAQVAAFDEAMQRGEGVGVLDGKIIENLHAETARQILAKAEAIAKQET